MKPLYDRYRLVKQMLTRASITPILVSKTNAISGLGFVFFYFQTARLPLEELVLLFHKIHLSCGRFKMLFYLRHREQSSSKLSVTLVALGK